MDRIQDPEGALSDLPYLREFCAERLGPKPPSFGQAHHGGPTPGIR
ncbi:hypothetical protein [Streptomyces acidicola]